MRNIIYRITKNILFIVIFCALFFRTSSILVNPETGTGLRYYQYVGGFFEKSEEALDAVFIGASNVYSSWLAPIAFEKYDLKIRSLAVGALGGDCFKEIIQNIHDIYPDALYIVALNSFLWETGDVSMHFFLDYWPAADKPKLIFDLYDERKIAFTDALEYLVPLVRFHSRWSQLQYEDFHHNLNGLKGANISLGFEAVSDVSDTFGITDKREELDANTAKALSVFLSYCEEKDIRILFVGLPWAVDEIEKAKVNYTADIVSHKDFDVINLSNYLDDIGLDPKQDYYDDFHTNIHGALKVTDYISRYLLAHYNFPKKSGGGYESWNEAYDKYKEIITPYLTEEELSKLP